MQVNSVGKFFHLISFHQNYIVIFDLRIVGLYISALVSFFLHHCLSSWHDIIKSLYYILHTMYLQLIYLVDTSQLGQQKNEWLPGFQQKCQNIASIYILSRLCALNKQPFKLNFWLKPCFPGLLSAIHISRKKYEW